MVKGVSRSKVKELFFAALERAPGERAVFLESACREDRDLLSRVDDLLHAYRAASGFLEIPYGGIARDSSGTDDQELNDKRNDSRPIRR